jgi:hypothetical protein
MGTPFLALELVKENWLYHRLIANFPYAIPFNSGCFILDRFLSISLHPFSLYFAA